MLAWIDFFTRLLNHWFAAPIDALLAHLHIHILHPAAPVDHTLTEELIVFAVMILFFIVVRLSLSVEKPGSAQHLAEYVHEFVENQAGQVMGRGHDPHLPILTCILVFILFCNCFGLLPGLETPTSNPVVPLGVALCAFVYYNWKGIRARGPFGYLKHFMGPVPWMAWMMFPIEIFSNFIRILSLTIRLYANMLASDLITLIFFSLIPLVLPIVGLGLHFFVALIQAYIFMLLNSIYLAEATAHEEH
ncbi:MAG TPA: F0F1 ATP synthase subunit A [Acidobacteriaceae bacterium]|nr:F0F1 ATP synthase subunit A [Acidobacteriaceae bacterium]